MSHTIKFLVRLSEEQRKHLFTLSHKHECSQTQFIRILLDKEIAKNKKKGVLK